MLTFLFTTTSIATLSTSPPYGQHSYGRILLPRSSLVVALRTRTHASDSQRSSHTHTPAKMALTGCFLLVAFFTTAGSLVAAGGVVRAGGVDASEADMALASGPFRCAASWRSIDTRSDSCSRVTKHNSREKGCKTRIIKQEASANSLPPVYSNA